MVRESSALCPDCGCHFRPYGSAKRQIRLQFEEIRVTMVKRVKCIGCGHVHRVIPPGIVPFKQYEEDVIAGFVSGDLDSEDVGFESCPSDKTISRWRRNFLWVDNYLVRR